MKITKKIIIFVALISISLISGTIPVRALTNTIYCVGDSTISTRSSNTNWGDSHTLTVEHTELGETEAVIQFDLSPISDVFYEAQLGFEVESLGGPLNISIYEMSSNWTEMGVTWNNVPPSGNHITDLYINETAFYLINITLYAEFVYLAQLGSLSVRLRNNNPANESNWVRIKSKEASFYAQNLRPQIRFYDTIKEPSIGIDLSIFITIGIISGVIGIITYRKKYHLSP